ncbi:MAG: hypothetical protein JXN61_04245, partial [Sedimentisphaerales bacterium]|nr:hypothetical protein [Sedimentisphaerales bacterium]
MKRLTYSVIVLLAGLGAFVHAGPAVAFVEGRGKIDVMIGSKLFTSYVCAGELTKPVLVPLRTCSGIEVTRRWPLTDL